MQMITAKEATKQHKALKSVWSEESKLGQKILISILALMERQQKPKRKPSAYNRFFARLAAKGKSAKEIAAEWKAREK